MGIKRNRVRRGRRGTRTVISGSLSSWELEKFTWMSELSKLRQLAIVIGDKFEETAREDSERVKLPETDTTPWERTEMALFSMTTSP